MATVATGQSNWANASARGKSRKAQLIDATRMRQLLQQAPDAIAASIAEMGYRPELDLYADTLTGVEKIEMQQYISRAYGSLTSFNVLFDNQEDHFTSK